MEDEGASAVSNAPQEPPQSAGLPPLRRQVVFAEIFAGSGVLTAEVEASGIEVRPPDEFATGGTDFRS